MKVWSSQMASHVRKKIKDTSKVHKLERKVNVNGKLYIIFLKIADDDETFHVQWYGAENDIICAPDTSSSSDGMYKKEEWLRRRINALSVITGFMKNASMNKDYFTNFSWFHMYIYIQSFWTLFQDVQLLWFVDLLL